MIKEEWKYLLKHKLMIIVFAVMIFIPSIYSVTFLKSMWDPYGQLKNLPVAVVNNDKSVNYQGTDLKVGKDLTKKLRNSKDMNFHILDSEQQAQKGLSDGKYYMVITIPKNFSQNATTLLNEKPKKMVLHYETSAGHNFTASKMTASAAQQAAQGVSEQVTKTYSKTMFHALKQVSQGMDKAATGNQKLTTGGQKLESANSELTAGLNTLATSSLTFSSGANTLNQGLNQYISGVDQVASGSQTLTSGIQQLNDKSSTLTSGINQLATGSSALTSGLQNYTSGVTSLNTASNSLNSGSQAINNGTNTLATNSQTLNSGLNQLHTASQELTDNLQKVSDNLDNTTQVESSIKNLKTQLASNNSQQANTIKNDLTSLQEAIKAQTDSNNQTNQRVSQIADQQGLSATQKAAILDAINSSDNSNLSQLTDTLSKDLTTLMTTQESALSQLDSLSNSGGDLSTIIAQLTAGSQQLTTQLQNASSGMNQLSNGIGELNANTAQLTHGTAQLNAGINQLADNSSTLNTGASSLNNGIGELNSQMPNLKSGISQLATGADSLNSGINQLVTNGTTLTSGATQLASGAQQINNGSEKLADGSSQMGSGLQQVTSGNNTLNKELSAGAKKSNIKATNLTYDQIAKPTTTKHKERDTAPNNGTGMAPYMLSVSLFVGALAFNLMFDIYTPRKFPRTGVSWWASKATITGAFVLLEAIAVFLLLSLIDGLAPVRPFITLVMLVLTGLTFMSIVHWLNLVLGKVGSFLSMILLVFQLGGSAGTYPIQLSNKFFESIHPWLPMSYSVDGLRQTLMIGDSAVSDMLTLLAITLLFSLLSILFFIRRKTHISEIDYTKEAAEHSIV